MAVEIKRLQIRRFRGIEELTWRPNSGLNLILGGGNVGKTTLLEAIALLLSPSTIYTLADSDYFRRTIEDGFEIEAVLTLPGLVNRQGAMAWPWEWDGQDAVVPGAEAPGDQGPLLPRPAVYRVRVRGTSDLEMVHEILQPDDSAVSFSVGLRREIGLVRLLGDDRNDRDLRLANGSSLERLINDRGLRARLGHELAADSVDKHLEDEPRARLEQLDVQFAERRLPHDLGLAFTGSAGQSINALIGLTADKNGVVLPLASWGAGTRRLAALTIGESLQDGQPITLVDELERGLEPYRQRQLVKRVSGSQGQTFVTTHSASVLSAASAASVWYVDTGGQVRELPKGKIARHVARDPEAFLARLAIVAEGATEVGFLGEVLDHALPGWQESGVHVTDGGGNDDALQLLEALSSGGVKFAGFVDNEGRDAGRWQRVRHRIGPLLFRWREGNIEQNVIPMLAASLVPAFIADPEDEKTGLRLRTLAERLGTSEADLGHLTDLAQASLGAAAGRWNHPLIPWIVDAASGKVPDDLAEAPPAQRNPFKGHASAWFKSMDGGRELARKLRELGVWDQQLRPLLQPFFDAVSTAQAGNVVVPAEDAA